MENKDILLEQMDRYLLGQMNEGETEQFMLNLNQHPEMKDELKIRQDMMKGIDTFVSRDLKQRLIGLQEEVKAEEGNATAAPRSISRKPYRWLVAAATLAILIAFAIWLNKSSNSSPEQLFANHYQAYQDVFSIRDETADPTLIQANANYIRGDYTPALPLFQALLTEDPNNSRLLLATGICELEVGNSQAALKHFQSILQLNDVYLGDQARWYAALTQVKQNNYQLAKEYLQMLADNEEADHHQEAIELIKQLK